MIMITQTPVQLINTFYPSALRYSVSLPFTCDYLLETNAYLAAPLGHTTSMNIGIHFTGVRTHVRGSRLRFLSPLPDDSYV